MPVAVDVREWIGKFSAKCQIVRRRHSYESFLALAFFATMLTVDICRLNNDVQSPQVAQKMKKKKKSKRHTLQMVTHSCTSALRRASKLLEKKKKLSKV